MAMGYDGSSSGSKDWTPGVKYLLVLLIAEVFVFGLFRTLTNHGG